LLAREHHRITSIRRSFLHEVSSQLAKTHSGLALEDLPVANLIRNKRLARAITDAAWSEFARQLRYKTAWLGGDLVVCDRWFPSTKTCSRCGRAAQQTPLAVPGRLMRSLVAGGTRNAEVVRDRRKPQRTYR
jgi:putative transposase